MIRQVHDPRIIPAAPPSTWPATPDSDDPFGALPPRQRLNAMLAAGRIDADEHARLTAAIERLQGSGAHAGPPPVAAAAATFPGRPPAAMLAVALMAYAAIVLGFTPYSHQLGEIKDVILFGIGPALALAALVFLRPWRPPAGVGLPLVAIGVFLATQAVALALRPGRWIEGSQVLMFDACGTAFALAVAAAVDTRARLRATAWALVTLGVVTLAVAALFISPLMESCYNALTTAWPGSHGVRLWASLFYMFSKSGGDSFYSTILSSEFYAAYLTATMPFAAALALGETRPAARRLAAAALLAMLMGLVATRDFPAALGFAVLGWPLLAWAARGASRRRMALMAVGVLLFSLVAYPAFPPEAGTRFGLASEGTALLRRAAALGWLYGADATHAAVDWSSVMLGNGPGAFRWLYPVHRTPDFFDHGINNVTTFSHSYWLDLLCDSGVAGLAAFVAMLGVLAWVGLGGRGPGSRAVDPLTALIAAAGLAGMAGMLASSSVWTSNRWAALAAAFWVAAGMVMAAARLGAGGARAKEDSPAGVAAEPRRRPGIAAVALAAALVAGTAVGAPRALGYWRAAVANSDGLVHMQYAETATATGMKIARLSLARDRFETAIAADPAFKTSYYKLAHVRYQLASLPSLDGETAATRIDGALAAYEALAAVDPHYSEIHQNLAMLLAGKANAMPAGAERDKIVARSADEARAAARQSGKPNVRWMADTVLAQADGGTTPSLRERRALLTTVVADIPRSKDLRDERTRLLPDVTARLADIDRRLAVPPTGP